MNRFLLLLLVVLLGSGITAAVSASAVSNGAPLDAWVASGQGTPDDDLVRTSGDPDDFTLSAAHPNPFNPRTSFSLTVHETQDVTVEVFNLLGVRVRHLFAGTMEKGETRSFIFDASDLPSGIYLYRVQGESFTATRQMTLLK